MRGAWEIRRAATLGAITELCDLHGREARDERRIKELVESLSTSDGPAHRSAAARDWIGLHKWADKELRLMEDLPP